MEIDLYNTCVLRHKWYNWISWTVIPYITTGQTITIEQQSIYYLSLISGGIWISKNIPDIVVGRLPIYLLALQRMAMDGRLFTSSQELGEKLGISAAQIRKDLSQFGEFGKQGTGYNISFLSDQLRRILNIDRVWDIAVVGAGDIGHAIAGYQGFADRGFRVVMIFDNDPEKVGKQIGSFRYPGCKSNGRTDL
jgi:biotin operon repressor